MIIAVSMFAGGIRITQGAQTLTVVAFLAPGGFLLPAATIVVNCLPAELRLSSVLGAAVVTPVSQTQYQEWTVIKGMARRAVHDVFAVEAVYTPPGPNRTPLGVRVRWHVRGNRLLGDLQGQGYGEVVTDVDRVVFNMEQLAEINAPLPERGARIFLPGNNVTLILDVRDPADGPITQTWEVVRE